MTRIARAITGIILVMAAATILDGCGRKEKLTPPKGADYPRQYPRE